MKKGKKIICLLLTIISVFTVQNSLYADSNYSQKEINYKNSRIPKIKVSNKKGHKVKTTEEIFPGITWIAEDSITSIEVKNNSEIKTHMTEIQYEISPEVINQTDDANHDTYSLTNIFGATTCYAKTGSNYVEDDACGFKILCYSTIKWQTKYVNGTTYLGIVNANGGVSSLNGYTGSNQGGGVYLQAGSVRIVQNGIGEKSLCKNQIKTINTEGKPHK